MEATRVLLVNCVNPFVEAQNRYPALGLGYLVAMLNRELGDAVEVRLIEDGVAEVIKDWQPHLLGLSSVSQNYNLAKSYAEKELSVNLAVQAGEDDKLFGSVSVRDIAAALVEQGYEFEHRQFQLDEPIKQLGVYTVPLRLHAEVEVPVKVWVTRSE